MEKIDITDGVVAEYDGKYWGKTYDDGKSVTYDFTTIDRAKISDARFCIKATDMTWDPSNTNGYNPNYKKLEKATLVKVKKTITIEIDLS